MPEVNGVVAEQMPDVVSRADAERLAREASDRARTEESRRLTADLERERAERRQLEERMAAQERTARENEIARLPAEQQVQARLTQMERDLAAERGARAQLEVNANHQIRQLGLVAYRERVLREVPVDVHHLVNGASEEEMDQAADSAVRTYNDLERRLRERIAAERPALPALSVQAPPPNPAYVAPPPADGGFPTATNPLPVPAEGGSPQTEVSELTSEQAVRSGRYGGEVREQLHARLRGNMRYQGQLGSTPRHWPTAPVPSMPTVNLPNGVQQPMGTPMGPARQPHMQAAPSPAPSTSGSRQPPAEGGVRGAAREAIARTHQGGNPVMGENPLAAQALATSQAFAQQRGIASPQAAFQTRFTHTPPAGPPDLSGR